MKILTKILMTPQHQTIVFLLIFGFILNYKNPLFFFKLQKMS